MKVYKLITSFINIPAFKILFAPALQLDQHGKFIISCDRLGCKGRLKKHSQVEYNKVTMFFCNTCGSMHEIVIDQYVSRFMHNETVTVLAYRKEKNGKLALIGAS